MQKLMKILLAVYADVKPLLEKYNSSPEDNNSKKSSIIKISKPRACAYLLITHCLFGSTKSKHDYCRGKDCMTNFLKNLRKDATDIINNGTRRNAITDKRKKS